MQQERCSSIFTALVSSEDEAWHAYMTGGRRSYLFKTWRSIYRGGCIQKCIANNASTTVNLKSISQCNAQVKSRGLCSKYARTPPQNKEIKCAPMIEQNPWEAQRSPIPATEVSYMTATSSFQKPQALPACLPELPADAFNESLQHTLLCSL